MIKATVKKSTGEEIVIMIPETGSEMTLSQALDFEFCCLDLFEWLKLNHDELESKPLEHIVKIIKCLNVFYSGIVDFYELDAKYLEGYDNASIEKHFEVIKVGLNKDQAYSSLMGIFNLIYAALKNTNPKLRDEHTFTYKDESFVFPSIYKDPVFNENQFKSPSVRQAIEILQAQVNYNNYTKELSKTDVKVSEFLYEKFLSELAVLLLKEGETIPTDETEFKKHMNERKMLFQDIDLQSAMDIEFWFDSYYDNLKKDKENYYYFNSSDNNDPKNADELSSQMNAKAKNEEVFKRIGFKSMLKRLLEIGAFRGRSTNDLDSVNQAPFTDAVKLVSIDNSQ